MREHVSAYIDGELTAVEAEKIRGHLAACAACRLLAERMRAVGSAVERIEAAVSPDFRETLFTRLEKEDLLPRRRSLLSFSWRWLAVPAAAAAAVALFLSLQKPPTGPAGPTAVPPRVASPAPSPADTATGRPSVPAAPGGIAPQAAGTAALPGAPGTTDVRRSPPSASAPLSAEDRDILAYLEILENPQMLEEPSPLEDPGGSTRGGPSGEKG